jgi:hypothetical protein
MTFSPSRPFPACCGQVGVAMAVWSQGVRISNIDLPFNLPLTGGWVVSTCCGFRPG